MGCRLVDDSLLLCKVLIASTTFTFRFLWGELCLTARFRLFAATPTPVKVFLFFFFFLFEEVLFYIFVFGFRFCKLFLLVFRFNLWMSDAFSVPIRYRCNECTSAYFVWLCFRFKLFFFIWFRATNHATSSSY